jgi:lipid II:glycine glycyltransferase (peptidoglycan interpeptide bridge formation enzyme)
MHEKCRYNIKLAWKRGVRVTWADPTIDHIDMWMELLTETTGRDGFSQNSREYYISFLQMLRDTKTGWLLFAGYNGRIIAAGIYVYYHNTALYYYGASTSDGELRKHMAPYMLQWEAIREGKLRGCQTYDFLGIAPPWDTQHSLAWVTNFKEKFWWEIITIGSKKLFIIRPIRYPVFLVFRFLKNSIRNLSLCIFSK